MMFSPGSGGGKDDDMRRNRFGLAPPRAQDGPGLKISVAELEVGTTASCTAARRVIHHVCRPSCLEFNDIV